MKNAFILLAVFILSNNLCVVAQVNELFDKAEGIAPNALKHKDQFTEWKKIVDLNENDKYVKLNYVNYRILMCTTILSKKTNQIAHPFGTIEIRAPSELKETTMYGYLHIVGKKLISNSGNFSSEIDTLSQFFDVSPEEQIFSVGFTNEFIEVINIYLTLSLIPHTETISQDSVKVKSKNSDLTDEQVKTIFRLIFKGYSPDELTITDNDRTQAKRFLQELLDGSCKFGYVDALKDFDVTLKSIISVIFSSYSNCESAKRGKYFETVRASVESIHVSEYLIRRQLGEW